MNFVYWKGLVYTIILEYPLYRSLVYLVRNKTIAESRFEDYYRLVCVRVCVFFSSIGGTRGCTLLLKFLPLRVGAGGCMDLEGDRIRDIGVSRRPQTR